MKDSSQTTWKSFCWRKIHRSVQNSRIGCHKVSSDIQRKHYSFINPKIISNLNSVIFISTGIQIFNFFEIICICFVIIPAKAFSVREIQWSKIIRNFAWPRIQKLAFTTNTILLSKSLVPSVVEQIDCLIHERDSQGWGYSYHCYTWISRFWRYSQRWFFCKFYYNILGKITAVVPCARILWSSS